MYTELILWISVRIVWILAGYIYVLLQGHCMFGQEVRGQQINAHTHGNSHVSFEILLKEVSMGNTQREPRIAFRHDFPYLQNLSMKIFAWLHLEWSEKISLMVCEENNNSDWWCVRRMTSLIDFDVFPLKFCSIQKTTEWKIPNIITWYCIQIKVFSIDGDCWSDAVSPKEPCEVVGWLACLSSSKCSNIQTKEASSKN